MIPEVSSYSKMSYIALGGNLAETFLTKSTQCLIWLEDHFKKKITGLEKVAGHTKTDIKITFIDGTFANIQLKSGTGGGRGWSVHRNKLDSYPIQLQPLLEVVCLKKKGERLDVPLVTADITKLFLGESDSPTHYLHIILKNNEIDTMTICTAEKFMSAICEDLYANYLPKRTCIHLSPLMYLQRKGGGKKDGRPNDIQLKLKKMPDCMISIRTTV